MNEAADSLGLDARALILLDRLLDASTRERELELEKLHGTDPALQARLARLLAIGDQGVDSQALFRPMVQGMHSAAIGSLRAGDLLAGYRLLRELGRGGMSSVWLAERADGELRRQVAIKLPLTACLSGPQAGRFALERDLLAGLNHPNIARLYDAGLSAQGQPFLVLEHVAGQPITGYAREHDLSTTQRLTLFLQVLAAVEHAHRHMVVHRDLKPSNILVDADGQVKLLDFGIAKLLTVDPGTSVLTQGGATAMTPRYAAPEQVKGEAISAATDVYSAGVVLYELLTGHLPYCTATQAGVAAVMQATLHDEPAPTRLGRDVDTVLGKAMAKSPEGRYPSIERFAEDLRRLLGRQPILACRVPWWHRLRLLLQRHPRVIATGTLAALALSVTGIIALQQTLRSHEQESRATAVRDFMFQMVSDAEPDEANPTADVTGGQIVDAAVARADKEFGATPLLQGELLVELGRVYARVRQHQKAIFTLGRAIEILRSAAPSGDATINKARAYLAGELISVDMPRSEQLAREVIAECTRNDAECAKARGYAHASLSILEGQRGQSEAAVEHTRLWVREAEQGFGPQDQNTAAALRSLAILERNQGRFDEASRIIARAVELTRQIRMRARARAELLRTQAILELDLGRFDSARQKFSQLLPGTTDVGERALLLRFLANTHVALGEPDAAVKAAEQSRLLAEQIPDPFEHALAMQARSRAEALQGRFETALTTLREAINALTRLGFAAHTREILRARRMGAEVLLRQGKLDAARSELDLIVQVHRTAGSNQGMEWAQALDLLGCIERAEGSFDAARSHHLAARDMLRAHLPAGHSFLLRNDIYIALAERGDKDRLTQAVERYRSTLPEPSYWRSLLQSRDSSPPPVGAPGERPLLIL